jgi:hypothetical protein
VFSHDIINLYVNVLNTNTEKAEVSKIEKRDHVSLTYRFSSLVRW